MSAEIGQRVRRLRKARSLSQHELATSLGLTRSSVANIETGRQKLTPASLIVLARGFGVSADTLLGLSPMPPVIPEVRIRSRGFTVTCAVCGDVGATATHKEAQQLQKEHQAVPHEDEACPPVSEGNCAVNDHDQVPE